MNFLNNAAYRYNFFFLLVDLFCLIIVTDLTLYEEIVTVVRDVTYEISVSGNSMTLSL